MASSGGYGDKRVSALATLAFLIGLGVVAVLFAAAFGYRGDAFGYEFGRMWDYGFALLTLTKYSVYAAGAGAVIGLIALGATLPGGNRHGLTMSVVALILCGGAGYYVGNMYWTVRTVPFIHDVATDPDNPPAFVAVPAARDAYAAARGETMNDLAFDPKVALQQRAGYSDIAPLTVAAAPAAVYEKAQALVEALKWDVVLDDPATWRIEATATSRFYHFKDDIAIVLTPVEEGGATHTRVDMRSASRVGRSDVGVNAERIKMFLTALENATR